MKTALSAKSDSELGRMLGVSQQAISNARNNKKLPDSWVRIAAERYDLSADWLFFGRGPMRSGEGGVVDSAEALRPIACPRCARLESELETERSERRELSAENRRLWRENADLRERCARMEEREKQGSIPLLLDKQAASRSSSHPENA